MAENDISYHVLNWWTDLSGMRIDENGNCKKVDSGRTGERARLRRCISPEQVIAYKEFYEFRNKVTSGNDGFNVLALATIAGLCSHIKDNVKEEFPKQLATTEDDKTNPPLSENRFQKLVSSKSPLEFYTEMRRAINLVGNKGNIPSIVKGILLWYRSRNSPINNIQDSFLFKWSQAYYDVILMKTKKQSKEE